MKPTLIHGDCLEEMPRLESQSIDLVLADPPYGTTACKWDAVIPFEPMWAELKRLAKPNAAIVLTASQPFTSALVMSNVRMFRHEWVWIKNRGSNFASLKYNPFKEHESVIVFAPGPTTYNPIKQERAPSGKSRANYDFKNDGGGEAVGVIKADGRRTIEKNLRAPSSWQKFNTEVGHHPTQKPVALMEYMIRTYTNEGATVLDFTMGSGTTGVACANLGRHFIGIEKEQKYFDIAQERITKALKTKED